MIRCLSSDKNIIAVRHLRCWWLLGLALLSVLGTLGQKKHWGHWYSTALDKHACYTIIYIYNIYMYIWYNKYIYIYIIHIYILYRQINFLRPLLFVSDDRRSHRRGALSARNKSRHGVRFFFLGIPSGSWWGFPLSPNSFGFSPLMSRWFPVCHCMFIFVGTI